MNARSFLSTFLFTYVFHIFQYCKTRAKKRYLLENQAEFSSNLFSKRNLPLTEGNTDFQYVGKPIRYFIRLCDIKGNTRQDEELHRKGREGFDLK